MTTDRANPLLGLLVAAITVAGCSASASEQPEAAAAAPIAPNPDAPRWQQLCEVAGGTYDSPDVQRQLAQRGDEGWELAATPAGGYLCYRRPAPVTPSAGGAH